MCTTQEKVSDCKKVDSQNVTHFCNKSKSAKCTPPRTSEISKKNWKAKVKPVLTPH